MSNGRTFRPVVGGVGPAVFGSKKVVVNETPRRPRNVHGSLDLRLRWTLAVGFPTLRKPCRRIAGPEAVETKSLVLGKEGRPFFFSVS